MERLNQWLTLVANFGVIAGFIFLAVEIRQNTEALHAESHQAIFSGGQEELYTSMEYPEIARVMAVADLEPSFVEQMRMDAYLAAALGARQFAWRQYQAGNLDEDTWASEVKIISILVGSERTRRWWSEIGYLQFQGEFLHVVSRIVENEPLNPYWGKVLEWHENE